MKKILHGENQLECCGLLVVKFPSTLTNVRGEERSEEENGGKLGKWEEEISSVVFFIWTRYVLP